MGEGIGSSEKRKKKILRKNRASLTNADKMDVANADKKTKKVARSKKRKDVELPDFFASSMPEDNEGKSSAEMRDKKRNKLKKKKREKEKRKDGVRELVSHSNEDEDYSDQQIDNLDGAISEKKTKKAARKKQRKNTELPEAETHEIVASTTTDNVKEGKNSAETSDKKRNKSKRKKKDKQNRKKNDTREYAPHTDEAGDGSNQQSGKSKSASQIESDATLLDDDEVYQISSGDEDETTGMKRWITKYHRARPGAEVLLEGINDFLVDYWAQKEKERKEREEEAAEGGWTVVTHFKGRKKTTDAESGTTVGSVAQAAVMDKMSKKKDKQVGINFYSFQKREAQRNEIMMLQSKFEQDKKRIQQLRAARKFRPY
ncbi:putative ribosomal RNA-processing protein [Helianthus annuus]|uniref:Ribosomal RNA-processing protein n=1 Tax=Helianthus annuus TaxID=4232 RepID=A0A251V7Q4_HELAN|nr:cylicin-1 isoform X2 [Helianthus annuus]KAF5815212.1 putative ribosomal RNA-processing protein [Helianthus annuus]KAJ0608740.1 putative ribosomal RNA-processing protein [Helianthus annuus]KAJ0774531.1 putative ribosomal RNA-processing protein [Helianthus annuus]KAJ0944464.1 putative ribosomal RNA-processing protein [Helianthus annuus]